MTWGATDAINLLAADTSWRGFPELRHCLQRARTRAEIREITDAANREELASQPGFIRRQFRLAVAGSQSTENLRDAITLQFLDRGFFCTQYHAPFGQLAQEIRDVGSGLYRAQPDLVVLIPIVSAYMPATAPYCESSAKTLAENVCDEISILRRNFTGPVMVQNFIAPEARPLGVLDGTSERGIANFYRDANLMLSRQLRSQADVFVLDAAHLVSFSGAPWISLHKSNYLAGCPLPEQLAMHLASDIAAVGAALKGAARKCLVVDLDNTLWGGVVGEDGLAGVQIGGSFPGNVYAALQREIKGLLDRGVILAINSRNNPQDVWPIFEQRPEMLLRKEHFSCARVNWGDKAANLREIARDLNIGLEAVVVLDDDPVQRGWIEASCPEVYVAPAGDPLEMLRFVSCTRLFDSLSVGREDVLRVNSYAASKERERLKTEKGNNLEDFLFSLDLTLEIGSADEARLGRVAQLTQKTNQFNLTTRRYSESRLRQLLAEEGWRLFYCSCRDRFADEGLIGTAIIRERDGQWEIDTFLLSCRVLGRGVEDAFLSWLCSEAARAGMRRLVGEFIPSDKNSQTQGFYQKHGFTPTEEKDGHYFWALDLPAATCRWPAWIVGSDVNGTVSRAAV